MSNNELFEEYRTWIKLKSSRVYLNTADMFIRELNKPLREIDKTDVVSFIKPNENPSTHDNKRYHIAKLLKFLNEKNIVSFTMKDIGITSKKIDERDKVEHWFQIPFNELILIRENLKKYPLQHFLFELVYQHGLALNELEMCNSENYDSNIGGFVLETREKSVYISKKIQQLIKNHTMLLNKRTEGTIKKYFTNHIAKKIREMGIDKQITWGDINTSHKHYCFRCFYCDTRYENTAENWVVANKTDSDIKFLMCVNCAKKFEEGTAK